MNLTHPIYKNGFCIKRWDFQRWKQLDNALIKTFHSTWHFFCYMDMLAKVEGCLFKSKLREFYLNQLWHKMEVMYWSDNARVLCVCFRHHAVSQVCPTWHWRVGEGTKTIEINEIYKNDKFILFDKLSVKK